MMGYCLDTADMPGNASAFLLTVELTKINILRVEESCIFQVIVTVSHAMSFGICRIHIRSLHTSGTVVRMI